MPTIIGSPKRTVQFTVGIPFGGPEGDRTLDLTDANRTLSQLSYGPIESRKSIPLSGATLS